jgi:hypothetical protein
MGLRPHRRNLVVWNQSAGSARRYDISPCTRFTGSRRIRAAVRAGALLPVIALMQLEDAVPTRWRVVLAGAVLTIIGLVLRGGPGGLVLLPGMMFLSYSPFIPGDPDAGRKQRRKLKRELAAYTTSAQRRDLEATLDRYPDRATGELRDILHNLAMAAHNNQLRGIRR